MVWFYLNKKIIACVYVTIYMFENTAIGLGKPVHNKLLTVLLADNEWQRKGKTVSF